MARVTFTEEQQAELHRFADVLDATELPQGRGVLKKRVSGDGPVCYCCLGVYIEETDSALYSDEPDSDGRYYCPIDLYEGQEEQPRPNVLLLPLQMKKAMGLDQRAFHSRTFESCLTSLNDMFEFNFSDIATEIRHIADHGKLTPLTERRFR